MPVFGMSLVLGWFACAVAVVAPWLAKALEASKIAGRSAILWWTRHRPYAKAFCNAPAIDVLVALKPEDSFF